MCACLRDTEQEITTGDGHTLRVLSGPGACMHAQAPGVVFEPLSLGLHLPLAMWESSILTTELLPSP